MTISSSIRFIQAGILAALASIPVSAAATERPGSTFEITTDQAFSAVDIPAYAGRHEAIYARIDADLDDHVAALQRWVRQRSISAQDDGIDAMARLVAADLEALGFQQVDLVETGGHPGVFGHYDAGAERTLMIYMMYDVQPVEPNWRIDDPFAGELVETDLGTVLMARGAMNQKGPERAFLNAVEAILETQGELPVNLMVVAEGEEELGSPHFPDIIEPYRERLSSADGAFFPMLLQSPDGTVNLNLGVKGILYFELEARGGEWGGPSESEIHGSFKALVDSPALRLVQGIASMTTRDGNTITIPGYYDPIRPPTPQQQRLINGLAAEGDQTDLRESLGVSQWIDGIHGTDAWMHHLYDPTLNINGIWSGYTGEGGKTILPHVATAKMDSRLPPGLEPDHALQLIRDHLRREGFGDLRVHPMSSYPAAHSPVDAPIVRTAISVFNKYGYVPRVSPWLAGSAPFYQFSRNLDLPFVFGGLGHGSGAHGPDEYMLIHPADGTGAAGLAEIEKAYVDMLYALSQTGD